MKIKPTQRCRTGRRTQKLLKFAARQKTASGAIFRAKSGKAMSRYQIWSKMKKLCARAGVDAGEGFPAQSAPPVRDGVLSRIQGHRQAGGCPRPFEHRNHAHLPRHECGGAPAAARAVEARVIGAAESIFRICKGSETISSLPLLVAKYSTIFRQRQGKL